MTNASDAEARPPLACATAQVDAAQVTAFSARSLGSALSSACIVRGLDRRC
jgi:hypothetical protein